MRATQGHARGTDLKSHASVSLGKVDDGANFAFGGGAGGVAPSPQRNDTPLHYHNVRMSNRGVVGSDRFTSPLQIGLNTGHDRHANNEKQQHGPRAFRANARPFQRIAH